MEGGWGVAEVDVGRGNVVKHARQQVEVCTAAALRRQTTCISGNKVQTQDPGGSKPKQRTCCTLPIVTGSQIRGSNWKLTAATVTALLVASFWATWSLACVARLVSMRCREVMLETRYLLASLKAICCCNNVEAVACPARHQPRSLQTPLFADNEDVLMFLMIACEC